MSTTDKLAEAIELAEDAMAYVPEYFANKHGMLRRMAALKEVAAHEQAQAAPLKERPDFIAGYYAGLADGRRCAERDAAERAKAGEPVVPYLYVYEYDSPFGLNREFYPSGWNGQKPTRTVPLYTTPQPALAQRREPLTDEQIAEGRYRTWAAEPDDAPEAWAFMRGARWAEKHFGIGATTGEQR